MAAVCTSLGFPELRRNAALPDGPTARFTLRLGGTVKLHLGIFGIRTVRCRDVIVGTGAPDVKLMRAGREEISLMARREIRRDSNTRDCEKHSARDGPDDASNAHTALLRLGRLNGS